MQTVLADPGNLTDGEIRLKLHALHGADAVKRHMPAYVFHILRCADDAFAGHVNLRVGYDNNLAWYAGHIGYAVEEQYRGQKYAARATRLLLPLALAHGMDVIWLTCNPDNIASRKTCENLGAELVGEVDLPADSEMYQQGERRKCRYRLILNTPQKS